MANPEPSPDAGKAAVPFRWRFALVIVAWCVALVSSCGGDVRWAAFILIFPLGLMQFLLLCESQLPLLASSGWLLYIALTGLLLTLRKRTPFLVLYVVLLVLLALNVKGCLMIRHDLAQIR